MSKSDAKRVGIEARVSTQEQADGGTSLKSQVAAARAYASERGYVVIEYYVIEEDHTGTDLERPGILRLLEAGQRGEIDIALFYTMDRLFRPKNEGDEWRAFELMHRLRELGVEVEFVDPTIPSDGPMSGLIAYLRSWAAGQERRDIIERTGRGRADAAAEGKWSGGPAPFGLVRGTDGFLRADPEQSPVVQRIFRLYDGKRMGLRAIQAYLEEQGIQPPGGKLWSQETIRRILKNRIYLGESHPNGALGVRLVDDELFARVQDRLNSNKRLKGARKSPRSLQSRIRCHCGGTVRIRPGRGRLTYACVNRYRWSSSFRRTGERCTVDPQPATDVLLGLMRGICDGLGDKEKVARLVEIQFELLRLEEADTDKQVSAIVGQLDKVKLELKRLGNVYAVGDIDDNEWKRRRSDLLDRRRELEGRLSAIDPEKRAKLERLREMIRNSKPLLDWAQNYGKALPFKGEGNFISFTPLGDPPVSMEDTQTIATMPTEWLANMGAPPHDEWTLDDVLNPLLDRLHAELVSFPEKIEVRGLIPFVIEEAALHASQVPRGLG